MREKVLLRLLFVHSQGSIEDGLEIVRKGNRERYLGHGSREETWSGLRVLLVLVPVRVGNPNLLNWLAGNACTASASACVNGVNRLTADADNVKNY